jgi:hypothetical protein
MISVPIHRVSMIGCACTSEKKNNKNKKDKSQQCANFYGTWYSIPVYPESLTAVALIHSGSQLIE